MDSIRKKREREKKTLRKMISLYCCKQHGGIKGGFCSECFALLIYAEQRTERCPYSERKTFCSNCATHCYRADMREKICKVMRWAGPRMLWHDPITALRHFFYRK